MKQFWWLSCSVICFSVGWLVGWRIFFKSMFHFIRSIAESLVYSLAQKLLSMIVYVHVQMCGICRFDNNRNYINQKTYRHQHRMQWYMWQQSEDNPNELAISHVDIKSILWSNANATFLELPNGSRQTKTKNKKWIQQNKKESKSEKTNNMLN